MRTRPDILRVIDLPSGKVTVDEYGYLSDPDAWTPDFAAHTASAEGVTLTPLHHEIIAFMRGWLDEHGIAADARFVLKHLARRDGLTKAQAKQKMYDLFPYGYVRQACKIAGMKQPRAWSTG